MVRTYNYFVGAQGMRAKKPECLLERNSNLPQQLFLFQLWSGHSFDIFLYYG